MQATLRHGKPIDLQREECFSNLRSTVYGFLPHPIRLRYVQSFKTFALACRNAFVYLLNAKAPV